MGLGLFFVQAKITFSKDNFSQAVLLWKTRMALGPVQK